MEAGGRKTASKSHLAPVKNNHLMGKSKGEQQLAGYKTSQIDHGEVSLLAHLLRFHFCSRFTWGDGDLAASMAEVAGTRWVLVVLAGFRKVYCCN